MYIFNKNTVKWNIYIKKWLWQGPLIWRYEGMMKSVLQHNPNVNVKINKAGNTLLASASKEGDTELVQQLLDLKADVNVQKANGDTPLIVASRRNEDNLETVALLLNNNANINMQE